MHPTLRNDTQRNIEASGQSLIGVFPTPEHPGDHFVYTIGNALLGLPELIIVGNFGYDTAGSILNMVGKIMRDSGQPNPVFVDLGAKFPIRTRYASDSARDVYTIQAGQFLGREDYQVQQLLLCDPNGFYPGDDRIDTAYNVPLI